MSLGLHLSPFLFSPLPQQLSSSSTHSSFAPRTLTECFHFVPCLQSSSSNKLPSIVPVRVLHLLLLCTSIKASDLAWSVTASKRHDLVPVLTFLVSTDIGLRHSNASLTHSSVSQRVCSTEDKISQPSIEATRQRSKSLPPDQTLNAPCYDCTLDVWTQQVYKDYN